MTITTADRSDLNAYADSSPADPAPVGTLPGQLVACQMEDGTTLTVRTTNRDRIAWEKTSPRHKWGSMHDSPNLAMAFLTWNAAKRDGQTTLTFDQWSDQLADYDAIGDADTRPTR